MTFSFINERRAFWTMAVGFGLLYARVGLSADLGVLGEDPAQYLLLAQSLATGQGYRDLFFPGHPPHVVYPPVFPALLAVVLLLAGWNFWCLHLPNVVCGAAIPVLTYQLVRGWEPWGVALLVATLTGLSPFVIEAMPSITSDLPYTAFSLLALGLLDRTARAEGVSGRRRWLRWALGIMVLAEFTRVIGVTLAIGAMLALGCSRMRKDGGTVWSQVVSLGLVGIGLLLLWEWRNARLSVEWGSTYLTGFLPHPSLQPAIQAGATLPWPRIAHAIQFYAAEAARIVSLHLEPLLWSHAPWVRWVVVTVIGIGWASRWFTRGSVLEWYVIGYVGALLLWPYYNSRYLLPLIAGVLYYFVVGVRQGARWLGRMTRPSVGRWGSVAVIVSVVVSMVSAAAARVCAQVYGARYASSEERLLATHSWAKANLPPDAILLSTTPALTALLTGRHTVGMPLTTEAQRLEGLFHTYRIRYAVLNELSHTGQETLRDLMRDDPSRWEALVAHGQSGLVRLRGEWAADEAGSR